MNIGLGDRSLLTFGIVTPVTNPKPFDYEVIALFNIYFGVSTASHHAPAADHRRLSRDGLASAVRAGRRGGWPIFKAVPIWDGAIARRSRRGRGRARREAVAEPPVDRRGARAR